MVIVLAQFIFSALLIIGAGIYLTRSADTIADLTGLGKLIIGSVLLAGATSLTELFVGLNAIRARIPELAMGNLLGACLINLFILALADCLHHSKSKRFSLISAGHALSACLLVILIIIVAVAILLVPGHGPTFLNASLPSYLLLATYLISMRIIFKNQNQLHDKKITFKSQSLKSIYPALLTFSISALIIAYACPILVSAAESISQKTGLGETFIGLTLVSITTSLPELVATLQAVRMGSYEMAFGNILGSNAYNILVIALLDFFVDGSIFAAIGTIHVFTCLAIIMCISVAIIGQLYQVERSKRFFEPDAMIIMGTVIISYYFLYQFTSS
ncbi:MAG TPA: hypothetical protein VKZ84_03850 [Bacteriovoracaceae bacterium]|nr:hypothetical protein [Bacteriovoracaceae bacterium]